MFSSQTSSPLFPYLNKNHALTSGFSYGRYSYRQKVPGGCYSGPLHYYDAKFYNGSLNWNYENVNKKGQSFNMIAGVMYGQQLEKDYYNGNYIMGKRNHDLFSFRFGAGYDWKAFGVYAGISAGQLRTQYGGETACPDLSVRIGNPKIMFMKVSYGNMNPGPNGPDPLALEAGSSFNTNFAFLKFGVSPFGLYCNPEFYFRKYGLNIGIWSTIKSLQGHLGIYQERYGITLKVHFNDKSNNDI